ncbi:type II secretion system F family protein [Bacillus litorisediminis]|uniref:type II secretion system F family protein n=1 Tax=Bacillus litorisediminis TaxID=2922713 RepID=UPI001FAF1996|nr:type II secretion system F family protein [Bacillus litorisediminis]
MMWLILGLVLFSSFLLFTALFQMIFLSDKRMQKRMKKYLEQSAKKKLSPKKFNALVQIRLATKGIQQQVLTKEKNSRLQVFLSRAGVSLKPEEYILFQWLATALVGGFFVLFAGNILFFPIGAIIGFTLPKLIVIKKQRDRLTKFNEQLPDMLTTAVGAMRAGFSFPQALKTVVDESTSPMKDEMETVLREMQYGSSIEEALNGLKERVPSEDLDLMIQAILIQRQVGGNLATVLEKIIETIMDRTKIQRQIKTLTAQGRLSGIVIGLLPIILGFVLYLIEPDYIGTLFSDTIGLILVIGAAISGSIGFFLIRKITTIEV